MPKHKNVNNEVMTHKEPTSNKPSKPPAEPFNIPGKPVKGTSSVPTPGTKMGSPRLFKVGKNYMGS